MKIMFVMVKEDYIDPMNIELLSALAKREGHEMFLNVLEHDNLLEEVGSIRPDSRSKCQRPMGNRSRGTDLFRPAQRGGGLSSGPKRHGAP